MRALALLSLLIAGCTAPQDAPAPSPTAVAPTPVATRAPSPTPSVAAVGTPEAVVRRYVAAIAARRYRDAWQLWEGAGKASGLSADVFAESFARYASFDATVGAAGREDAGAGQRYVTVPVRVTGRLVGGGGFVLEGPVILHRVADGIESDDPDAHAWRIRDSALKPRPEEE